ncbi:hypothetical protein BCI9360_02075 [Bacillus sp. CECT 9360]|nr:hypothetical protein BCI9360_02075 [Bacillus sp. CECT 9360]
MEFLLFPFSNSVTGTIIFVIVSWMTIYLNVKIHKFDNE